VGGFWGGGGVVLVVGVPGVLFVGVFLGGGGGGGGGFGF
jgi:hypothetical protein